jgi:hypothetical protein
METECYVEALQTIYRYTQCHAEFFVIYTLYEAGNSPDATQGFQLSAALEINEDTKRHFTQNKQ